MANQQARVGIVVAGTEELEPIQPARQALEKLGCHCEVLQAEPWRDPMGLLRWAEQAEMRGLRVLLVAAGRVPQLPALIAAATRLPVIAIPLAVGSLRDAELTQLALSTAPTAPVAAVEPGGAEIAALQALRILATGEDRWVNALERYARGPAEPEKGAAPRPKPTPPPPDEHFRAKRKTYKIDLPPEKPAETEAEEWANQPEPSEDLFEFVDDSGEKFEIRRPQFDKPLEGKVARNEPQPEPEAEPLPAKPPRKLGRRWIDPEAPEVEMIEDAVDCLLEGGVISLPTETVYGLAADATNPRAVERLFALKGRERSKSITLLIDSPRLLAGIARNVTVEVRRLMEAFWPGPLTIIFQKRAGNFDHVSPGETIGVRLPDHSVPLALMQALARPLACTSANLSELPDATNADQIIDYFGEKLNLVLDSGELPPAPPSTVLDVTKEPYRILRQGPVTAEQIAAIVGDKIEF
ncbi:MAG: L-threonylcarbamoyladenylate synthase [Candidatus Sumerlaeia bacterium]